MGLQEAKEYLKQFGLEDRVMEFPVSSATVELAAQALNCRPGRIAKTMSFRLGEQVQLILLAGDVRIDNKKYKAAFGAKAAMLPPGDLPVLVGHPAGGVCPFGVKEGVAVYLDESLRRFETVFPACGSGNSAIELSLPQLAEVAASRGWVDIAKMPENAGL